MSENIVSDRYIFGFSNFVRVHNGETVKQVLDKVKEKD